MKKRPKRNYVAIGPVRKDVAFLEAHYGNLLEASEATGIPYRTLQGIRLKGKLKHVMPATAGTVRGAVEVVQKQFVSWDRLRPLMAYLEDLYGSTEEVAFASGIALENLTDARGVDRESATTLTQFVMLHKRPTRTVFDGTYENEGPARFITSVERARSKVRA